MSELDFLLAHAPPSTAPVAPAVVAARKALETAGRELVGIPDASLERGWQWRNDEADVRYGLYRGIEAIEAADAAIGEVLQGIGPTQTPAGRRIAPATVARWALHGRLVALSDDWLDRHPKAGEWTIREVLGHIVSGQRAYVAYTAWWSSRPADEPPPDRVLEEVQAAAALPDEEDEGVGSLTDIRGRLDMVLDRGAAHMAGLSAADLAKPARWAGIPVDVGFRLGRWSSHLLEHTVQLDKTLDWLKRRPTEAERIVRNLYVAWGRLETRVVPLEPRALTTPDPDGRTIDARLGDLATELVADARSARAAAEA